MKRSCIRLPHLPNLHNAPYRSFRITRTHNEHCWKQGAGSEWHQATALDGKSLVLVVAELIRRHPRQQFMVWYRWRPILRYSNRLGILTRSGEQHQDDDWSCWTTEMLDCETAIKRERAKHTSRILRVVSRATRNRRGVGRRRRIAAPVPATTTEIISLAKRQGAASNFLEFRMFLAQSKVVFFDKTLGENGAIYTWDKAMFDADPELLSVLTRAATNMGVRFVTVEAQHA